MICSFQIITNHRDKNKNLVPNLVYAIFYTIFYMFFIICNLIYNNYYTIFFFLAYFCSLFLKSYFLTLRHYQQCSIIQCQDNCRWTIAGDNCGFFERPNFEYQLALGLGIDRKLRPWAQVEIFCIFYLREILGNFENKIKTGSFVPIPILKAFLFCLTLD